MDTTRSRVQTRASAWAVKSGATALDDEEKRRGRLLLLGKGAVLAHRFDRPLAAESDEQEQRAGPPADVPSFDELETSATTRIAAEPPATMSL